MKSIVPARVWGVLQQANGWRKAVPFRFADRQGWNLARKDDYYSPLPVIEDLDGNRQRWDKPSALVGVRYDLSEMQRHLADLAARFGEEFRALPSIEELQESGLGVGYTRVDAEVTFLMTRHLEPKRIIEVGSGVSTFFTRAAGDLNAMDGKPCEITCIEPFPYEGLRRLDGVTVDERLAQDVPLDVFEQLESGDVLFIDSSHSLKIDSDVAYLLLEVLPRLQPGVYVHIHDVPFPRNYPYPADLYIFNRPWPNYWNEPMAVQAFLAFNSEFEVLMSPSIVFHEEPEFFEQHVQSLQTDASYLSAISSLWIRRRPQDD